MDNLNTLYYERFLPFLVELYSPYIKEAKAGHCMKITGLPIEQLEVLYPMLKGINDSVEISILSESKTGADYITASKLIELRNDPSKRILILVPSNSRTSAEDSYGDATFQNLSAAALLNAFYWSLRNEVPREKKLKVESIIELLKEADFHVDQLISYLLFLEKEKYQEKAFGEGLYIFGMMADPELTADETRIRRRFFLNLEKVSLPLGDFSQSLMDRILELPLENDSVQKELYSILKSEGGINDRESLFRYLYENHPEINYTQLPWVNNEDGVEIEVKAELLPGKDPKKELVRDDQNRLTLSIPIDKKGKVSVQIFCNPSPRENPDIMAFEITLVEPKEFKEVALLKKVKITTNKGPKRKVAVNISNGLVEEGSYLIRVVPLDSNGIELGVKKAFKKPEVQEEWEKLYKENPNLSIEQFRIEKDVLFINETDTFYIYNNGEEIEVSDEVDKRAKVNGLFEAQIKYRINNILKGTDESEESFEIRKSEWVEGNLNDTYQFDFGPSLAFQIQQSKKLILLERIILENSIDPGHIEALISANPTDTHLYDPEDWLKREPKFIKLGSEIRLEGEFLRLRQSLFDKIRNSTQNYKGLTSTFDFQSNIGLVKDYLSAYERWLTDVNEKDLDEKTLVEIQNIDSVKMTVEMPDGSTTTVKLLTPLHPLRLSWMVNLLELYKDWENKTLENPTYKKFWSRKNEKLFLGELPLNIAPLVLSDNSLKEAYQYAGEITFGWAMFARPLQVEEDEFVSGARQLKSYLSELLNVAREKRIDADVSRELVTRHLYNFAISHPYTDKLVINLFNAGDSIVFAQSLLDLERIGIGDILDYEIRLFADDNLLQTGEAFKLLLDPESKISEEAEKFSQPSKNRLFPKLRFSVNSLSDFINNHDKYQAHISFLINPFGVVTDLARPNDLKRSFYLNGTICRNVVDATKEGKSFVWRRYFSNKALTDPSDEWANTEVGIFARIQDISGKLLSSTIEESVPATTLRLNEKEMMLLSFVHDSSDWVVTFDKNMGPEFYDLPCLGENDVPYLLDYIPKEETTGISSYLTTKPTSEIASLLIPVFKDYGIDIESKRNFRDILEDVRSVSSSILMQVNATALKGFEVIGTILTKRFLEKKHIMRESFMIPIDLHKELFEDLDTDKKERADNLVVKINPEKKEILFSVVEIKCRNSNYNHEELHKKMVAQIQNTISALKSHFEPSTDGQDRLDRELKTLELQSFLEFYVNRAIRYNQLNKELADKYLLFLSKLSEGYILRFKELGVVFDFNQQERQKKDYVDEVVIYTMGQPVLDMILDDNSTLNTQKLEDLDRDFINQFEPTLIYHEEEREIIEDNPVITDVNDEKDPQPVVKPEEIIIPEVLKPEVAKHEEEKPEEPKPVEPVNKEDEVEEVEEVEENDEIIDPNYQKPTYDLLIGKNGDSPQYGILGKVPANGRKIGIDLNECNTISLFGVQGAGKSYTIGSITEMVLKQFSNVNRLPAPMASVIFHYSDSMDYAPEFTSLVYSNDEKGQLAKLKAEYGAEAGSIKDVILLAPESQVEERKRQYPDLEVYPICFDSSELNVKDWMFLLGAMGNDSTYIKELKQIMKGCRHDMSLENIRRGIQESEYLSSGQRRMAEQRLKFAEEYITDGTKLQRHLKPGRLVIVDLRDELIEKEEALGLFVVMLNIFSGVMSVDSKSFNKFIVFDEAHKYMNNRDLVDSITTAIREMRHKGVSVMIASQDPMSLPTEIIELSSIVVMHKFSSPAWVKHVQKAITPLQNLTPTEMSSLGSGEAFVWANKATDKSITLKPMKISIRPRVTKHGGDTIQAVK